MFDADRPIQNNSQDRLNRTVFAKYLARSILDQPEPDSFVIGLAGEAGSGKTSVLNLVMEEIYYATCNMADDEKPIVFHFNPWSYSGQGSLAYYFFRDLLSEVKNSNYLTNSRRLKSLLARYFSLFNHQAMDKLDWFLKRRLREKLIGRSGHELILVKEELNECLIQGKHKIIITIDNISHLSNDELKEIFKIVKSICDLKNTIYILVIENKINVDVNKLVQVHFDIPPILERDLELILADRLQTSLALVPEESWDKDAWFDVYGASLKYFFKNCRDITRYVNTLNISYPHSKELVCPTDYFALTAIKIFMPEIYAAIRDNKDLFTDLIESAYPYDEGQLEKDKLRCDEIFSRNKHVQEDQLLELMLHLFPRLRHFYRPNEMVYHSASIARKNHRISCPDLFNVYFQLAMQRGDLPLAEFKTLMSIAVDKEAFSHVLMRLNQDDTIIPFLEHLDSPKVKKINRENSAPIIAALLDTGDLFPEGIQGHLNLSTLSRIHRIIHNLLQLIDSQDLRFSILQEAIANAVHSIYVIVYELKAETHEHLEDLDTFLPETFRTLSPEHLHSLKQLAATRIQYWAHSGRLSEHPKLFLLLEAWREWDPLHHAESYVEKLVESDKGLLAFLVSALDQPIFETLNKFEKNPTWVIYLDAINQFVSVESLIPHARLLFEDAYFEKLREKEQLAIMIFLDLTHADTIKNIPKTTV